MFELNKNLDVSIKRVGPQNRTIITADNFYKNPDEIRNLSLRLEKKTNESLIGDLPGQRIFKETSEVKKNLKPFFDE